jgi:hypothetical protein
MPASLSSTRLARVALVALTVLACAATALPADTAKQRQARRDREKKAQAQATRKKQADAEKKKVGTAAQGTSQTVKLEEHGVQYTLPANWTQAQVSGLPGLVGGALYRDPQPGRRRLGQLMVRVLPVGPGATLDTVVASVARQFNCCGPHYEAKPGDDVVLGGETGRTVVLEPKQEMVQNQKLFVAAAQHGERAYVFTLLTKADHYAAVQPDAVKVLKTVKWLGPKIAPTDLPERPTELLVDAAAPPGVAPAAEPAAPPAAAPPAVAPPPAVVPPPAGSPSPAGAVPPLPSRRGRPGLKVFESPDGDFSLEYAVTWAKRDVLPVPQAKLIVYPAATENAPGNLAEHFVVAVDQAAVEPGAAEPTGADVAEQMVAVFTAGDPEAQVLSRQDVKVHGVPAQRVTMAFTASGFPTKRAFVCAVHEGRSYTFSYSADPAEFERWLPLMDAITESVRWTRPPPAAAAPPQPAMKKKPRRGGDGLD